MSYEISAEVIEQIGRDVGTQIPPSRVARVAHEVAASFADAKVLAYVPLFVRRYTCERLAAEAAEGATVPPGGCATPPTTH